MKSSSHKCPSSGSRPASCARCPGLPGLCYMTSQSWFAGEKRVNNAKYSFHPQTMFITGLLSSQVTNVHIFYIILYFGLTDHVGIFFDFLSAKQSQHRGSDPVSNSAQQQLLLEPVFVTACRHVQSIHACCPTFHLGWKKHDFLKI